jgi:acyl dehydratase
MTQYRRFDEVAVGDVFPPEPMRFPVTPEVVARFLDATGNDDPAYAPGSGRAPSMIAAVYLIDLLSHRRSPPGGIHAKQAVRFHRPVAVGDTLLVQGEVVETYVRKDRPYVVSRFDARDAGGNLVASGLITSIWGKDP